MIRNICVVVVAWLLVVSCHEKREIPTVKVDIESIADANLSHVADSVGLIALQMGGSYPIGSIVSVLRAGHSIFINDGCRRVLQFDTLGRLVRQVGAVGKGPHEYLSAIQITADTVNGNLYVADHTKINIYNFEGGFVGKIKTSGVVIETLSVINNQLYVVSTLPSIKMQNGRYQNRTYIMRYAADGRAIDTLCAGCVEMPNVQATINPINLCISRGKTTNFFFCPVLVDVPAIHDTLMSLQNDRIEPFARFNFGLTGDEAQYRNFKILGISMYNHIALVRYMVGASTFMFYNDFDSNISYNMSEGFVDDIFGTGTVEILPLDTRSNMAIFVKYAYELDGCAAANPVDDNPVLFIIRLKDRLI